MKYHFSFVESKHLFVKTYNFLPLKNAVWQVSVPNMECQGKKTLLFVYGTQRHFKLRIVVLNVSNHIICKIYKHATFCT
jgi:hypothetical protein